jgi:hypothetical protein
VQEQPLDGGAGTGSSLDRAAHADTDDPSPIARLWTLLLKLDHGRLDPWLDLKVPGSDRLHPLPIGALS